MNVAQAEISLKSLNSEIMSLSPSSLIQLFEIDVSQIALDNQIVLPANEQIFRFHNHVKLSNTSIFWQGNEYVATPIQVQGFETNVKGVLPVPKLSLTVADAGVSQIAAIKQQLRRFGDLTGAKVTRIRTFSRFLDARNFPNGILPAGFETDEYAEFPRDVFYVDRKSNETKNGIEFELASLLDIEGIKLPARIVVANRCTWTYRGEGCLYSGIPVSDENDADLVSTLKVPLVNRGEWDANEIYKKGQYVYITKDNVRYYFVAKNDVVTSIPPNSIDWVSDACSKSTKGCRARFSRVGNGYLPFGGFPAANRT